MGEEWKMWGVDVLLVLAEKHGGSLWSRTAGIDTICGAVKGMLESDDVGLASKAGWLVAYYTAWKQQDSEGEDMGRDGIEGMEGACDALRRIVLAEPREACVWLAARAVIGGEGPADDVEEIRRAIMECLERKDNVVVQESGLRAVSWFVPRMDLGFERSSHEAVKALAADKRATLRQLAQQVNQELALTVRAGEGLAWVDGVEMIEERAHNINNGNEICTEWKVYLCVRWT
jgi:hypothetical protein